MDIELKEISSTSDGITDTRKGPINSYVRSNTYRCPCGKGTVKWEKDSTPGFRDTMYIILCDECRSKYNTANKGYLTLK